MSGLGVKHVKLLGDMMHMVSYSFLFVALRKDRPTKIGISFNSQFLFFLALLSRYLNIVLETKDIEKAMNFFTGKRGWWSISAIVDVYSKSSTYPIYVFLLKAFPLIFSAALVLRILSSAHWQKRDSFGWLYIAAPCFVLASFLHQSVIHDSDPLAVAKTFSHLVEALAVVPQLYMMSAPPEEEDGERPRRSPREPELSILVEMHLMCRGLFRIAYVSTWVYKVLQAGRGLEGAYVENLPHLAGVLQALIFADVFASFFRRHVRLSFTLFGLMVTILLRGGSKFLVQIAVLNILFSILASLVSGGFVAINLVFAFTVGQLVRAGVLYFRNPLEVLGLM